MRREVVGSTEHLEVLGVVLASWPVADDRFDRVAVMHVEDRVPVEGAAVLARVRGSGEGEDARRGPDVMFGPGSPAFGRADTLAAGCGAAAVVAGPGFDRPETGPAVYGGVHSPQDIHRVRADKRHFR